MRVSRVIKSQEEHIQRYRANHCRPTRDDRLKNDRNTQNEANQQSIVNEKATNQNSSIQNERETVLQIISSALDAKNTKCDALCAEVRDAAFPAMYNYQVPRGFTDENIALRDKLAHLLYHGSSFFSGAICEKSTTSATASFVVNFFTPFAKHSFFQPVRRDDEETFHLKVLQATDKALRELNFTPR